MNTTQQTQAAMIYSLASAQSRRQAWMEVIIAQQAKVDTSVLNNFCEANAEVVRLEKLISKF